jgi:hypothetical protein
MTSISNRPQNVIVGIFRVARGRSDGIEYFGASSQTFLASLAPLLAFLLVGTAIGLFREGAVASLTEFAMYVCALLTPAVLSFEMARWWGRGDRWLRFATAFNWCQWILPLVFCLLMIPISVAIGVGLDVYLAGAILLICLMTYGLWLHWFLACHGLSLSKVRAAVLVVVVNAAMVLLTVIPRLITVHVS